MGVTHGYSGTRTIPDAWRGVRQEPLRHAEARLWSIPATAVVWSHTADGVSAGCLAADTGPVTRRPSVRTTQRRQGGTVGQRAHAPDGARGRGRRVVQPYAMTNQAGDGTG
jgi:hypothetical protein